MKREFIIFIFGLFVVVSVFPQQSPDWRSKWEALESNYSKDYEMKLNEERKKLYIKTYFDLGKEYYFAKDYPSALVCFRKVIELEKDNSFQEFTPVCEKFLEEIYKRLAGQIEKEFSYLYGEDFKRLKSGIEEILSEVGKSPPEEEKTQEDILMEQLQQELSKKKKDIEKEKKLMELQLEKEALEIRHQIDKFIFAQKVKNLENKRKAEEKVVLLRELYKKGSYQEAIKEADEILQLDPLNKEAKKIKEAIFSVMEKEEAKRRQEEELEKKKREEERKRAKEEEKKRKEEEELARKREELNKRKFKAKIDGMLKKVERALVNESYRTASELLQEVISLDPNNEEAVKLWDYFKVKLEQISKSPSTNIEHR
ncbi:MAG: hypothetical protein NC820_07625 [Candidatus Omnitrophica bacterium]|nr:hypothetical protein [Candidatus Omnitrophota bacterium]